MSLVPSSMLDFRLQRDIGFAVTQTQMNTDSEGHFDDRTPAGVWRDGKLLVVRDGATLPRRCPKCNDSVIEPLLELTNTRRQGRGMVGAAVAEAIDQHNGSRYFAPVHMKVYFCAKHHGRRRQLVMISAACLILGAAGTVTCWLIDPKNGLSGGFFFPAAFALAGLAGLVETLRGENPWFSPKRFDDRCVWVEGACAAFLDTLPSFDP